MVELNTFEYHVTTSGINFQTIFTLHLVMLAFWCAFWTVKQSHENWLKLVQGQQQKI
jgi:hypothetical protein